MTLLSNHRCNHSNHIGSEKLLTRRIGECAWNTHSWDTLDLFYTPIFATIFTLPLWQTIR